MQQTIDKIISFLSPMDIKYILKGDESISQWYLNKYTSNLTPSQIESIAMRIDRAITSQYKDKAFPYA